MASIEPSNNQLTTNSLNSVNPKNNSESNISPQKSLIERIYDIFSRYTCIGMNLSDTLEVNIEKNVKNLCSNYQNLSHEKRIEILSFILMDSKSLNPSELIEILALIPPPTNQSPSLEEIITRSDSGDYVEFESIIGALLFELKNIKENSLLKDKLNNLTEKLVHLRIDINERKSTEEGKILEALTDLILSNLLSNAKENSPRLACSMLDTYLRSKIREGSLLPSMYSLTTSYGFENTVRELMRDLKDPNFLKICDNFFLFLPLNPKKIITLEEFRSEIPKYQTSVEKAWFIEKYRDVFPTLNRDNFILSDLVTIFRGIDDILLADNPIEYHIIKEMCIDLPPCVDLGLDETSIRGSIERISKKDPPPSFEIVFAIIFSYLERFKENPSDFDIKNRELFQELKIAANKYKEKNLESNTLQYELLRDALNDLVQSLPPREKPMRQRNINYGKPETFETESQKVKEEGLKKFLSHRDFNSLCEYFKLKRGEIALLQNPTATLKYFGVGRTPGLSSSTPLRADYAEYGQAFYRIMLQVYKEKDQKVTEERDGWTYEIKVRKKNNCKYICQTYLLNTQSGSKKNVMSSYILQLDSSGKFIDFSISTSQILVLHTPPENIAAVKEKAEFYFNKANECKNDQELFLENIALFRFFYAHAMPEYRGSAAIGEWLEQTLTLAVLGKEFQYGTKTEEEMSSGDLDALISPTPSAYIKTYKEQVRLSEPSSAFKAILNGTQGS